MGTQNKRFRTVRDLSALETARQNIQYSIDENKGIEQRRQHGQFATPFVLADEIISYGLELLNSDEITFLEPSIGTGAFYSALLKEAESHNKQIVQATGIEMDTDYINGAISIWSDTNINIFNNDFTHTTPNGKYNFVITNPPYVRHHYITQKEKFTLNHIVKNETNIDISGLSGLYCYFILLAHKWLAPGAISGWLVPSEFMDVNYGNAVKKYLLDNVHLLKVHRYDPENLKFNDALVSSCVIWFKNEIIPDDYEIEFSYSGSHIAPAQSKMIKKSVLLSERKWTRFPEKEIRSNTQDNITIGDYFTIKRGLATGDNKFFILTKDKIEELGLDMTFFKPVLPSPRYLKTDIVESDSDGNPKIKLQYYLFDCELTEDEIQISYPAVWDYLQSGLSGTSKKYLCKSRKTWYRQEQRQATRFLCSYMGRGNTDSAPIRFILNLSEAIVTNSYLMLYPKDSLQQVINENPEIVYQIWEELKTIGAEQIEDEGRIYGGGLKKIEPKELAKVSCKGLQEICSF